MDFPENDLIVKLSDQGNNWGEWSATAVIKK